jgi:hypothetical protein
MCGFGDDRDAPQFEDAGDLDVEILPAYDGCWHSNQEG